MKRYCAVTLSVDRQAQQHAARLAQAGPQPAFFRVQPFVLPTPPLGYLMTFAKQSAAEIG